MQRCIQKNVTTAVCLFAPYSQYTSCTDSICSYPGTYTPTVYSMCGESLYVYFCDNLWLQSQNSAPTLVLYLAFQSLSSFHSPLYIYGVKSHSFRIGTNFLTHSVGIRFARVGVTPKLICIHLYLWLPEHSCGGSLSLFYISTSVFSYRSFTKLQFDNTQSKYALHV